MLSGGLDLSLNSLMEVLNGKYQERRLALIRTCVNARTSFLRCPMRR